MSFDAKFKPNPEEVPVFGPEIERDSKLAQQIQDGRLKVLARLCAFPKTCAMLEKAYAALAELPSKNKNNFNIGRAAQQDAAATARTIHAALAVLSEQHISGVDICDVKAVAHLVAKTPPRDKIIKAMVNSLPSKETDARCAMNSVEEAKGKLVSHYAPLVQNMAWRYPFKNARIVADSTPDLVQEGMIGLLYAAERFDPSQGAFAAYARDWVRATINGFVRGKYDLIKIPRSFHDKTRDFQQHGNPDSAELNDALAEALQILAVKSFDDPIRSTDGQITIGDLVHDPEQKTVEECVYEQELREKVTLALDELSSRETDIIKQYYGFDSGEEPTFDTIGKKHNITGERVRQLHVGILGKLRTKLASLDSREIQRPVLKLIAQSKPAPQDAPEAKSPSRPVRPRKTQAPTCPLLRVVDRATP